MTYPGLFVGGSAFHPVDDVSFIEMKDMLKLQALFAAGQFLAARCKEHGLVGLSDANPFIKKDGGTFACLYSEMSLVGATLGAVQCEIVMGACMRPAQCAYADFVADMAGYAPWLRFPDGAPSFCALIKEAQAKLQEVMDLQVGYQAAKENFEQQQKRQRV